MSAAPSYVAIPVDALVDAGAVEFDLYVQLNSRHVLYLRKGGEFDTARLTKMREKNVKNMWILAEDEAQFKIMYARRLDEYFDPASKAPIETRMGFIHQAQIEATAALLENPGDVGAYATATTSAKRFTELMLKNDRAFKTLLNHSKTARGTAAHGVSVAAIALALAKTMGAAEQKDLHLLNLGCMLHDMGHGKESATFGKGIKTLAPDQAKLHSEHPAAAVQMVKSFSHYDQHVVDIMLEHEELINGTGFPKGLTETKMHLYPLLCSTANSFDQQMATAGGSPIKALKGLVVEKIGLHPLSHINALKIIVASLNG